MRRAVLSALCASTVLAGLPAVAGTSGQPRSSAPAPTWVQSLWSAPTSGWTRSTEVRGGTWIYTDPVFDDGGAGAGATYPSDGAPYNRNAADLVEVRLRRTGGSLSLGVRVNTLLDRSVPVVAVGFTDPSTRTAALPWPNGSGVRARGVRWVVSMTAAGATTTDLKTGRLSRVPLVVANDTKAGWRQLENTLTARVHLPVKTGFGVVAAAGVRQGAGWFHGASDAPAPFDLSFLPEKVNWSEGDWERTVQGSVLASGDLTRGVLPVDFRDRGVRVPVGQARTRIYRPSIEMRTGEGIADNHMLQLVRRAEGTPSEQRTRAPLGSFYKGLYLPYSVWVPSTYTGRAALPLVLNLHGIGANHQSHVFPHWPGGGFTASALAMQPLGRSEYGYYQREAALDVFEALADLKRSLRVDEDRVVLSGFSMGGVGTFTLGTQRPDLFAAAVPIAGTGSGWVDFLWPVPPSAMAPSREEVWASRMGSFGRELMVNSYNLPYRAWYAGPREEFILPTYVEGDAQEWERLGYDYSLTQFLERPHEVVPPIIDAVYHHLLTGCRSPKVPGCKDPNLKGDPVVRDRNPARVVYKALPYSWGISEGLRYDGAYWVSAMRLRDGSTTDKFAFIDATSGALARKNRSLGSVVPTGVHTFAPTGDAYRYQARRWKGAPGAPSRRLDVTLANLAGVTLDLTRAGLGGDAPITLQLDGDGRTRLTLRGTWSTGANLALRQSGRQVAMSRASGGKVVFDVNLLGDQRYELSRV